MIQAFRLRAIYAIHMLAPLAFVSWHLDRLRPETLHALRALFS